MRTEMVQETMFGVGGRIRAERRRWPGAGVRPGDRVDYSETVGGPVTSRGHTVEEVMRAPNPWGHPAARISGVKGWVSTKALARAADGEGGGA